MVVYSQKTYEVGVSGDLRFVVETCKALLINVVELKNLMVDFIFPSDKLRVSNP